MVSRCSLAEVEVRASILREVCAYIECMYAHLGEAIAHILSLVQQEAPPGDGGQGTVCDEVALGMPQGKPCASRAPSLMHLCRRQAKGLAMSSYLLPCVQRLCMRAQDQTA